MGEEELVKMARAIYGEYFARYKEKMEDLVSEGILGMLRAQKAFDESYNTKLSTYLWQCGKNAMMMYLKGEQRFERLLSEREVDDIYEFIPDESAVVDYRESCACEIEKIRELVSSVKNENTRAIMMAILDGKKAREISQEFGVTRQWVSSIVLKMRTLIERVYKYQDGSLVKKRGQEYDKGL